MDTKSTLVPGAWTARRVLALLGTIFIWFAVAVDAWYLWPTNLGGSTSFVIVSGSSMEPTYFGGDLVIARKMEPSIGDVIVYAPEGFGGAQIVHRIIGGNGEDGWVMQGDNNTFIDPFEPKEAEVRGVVVVHYSSLGQLTALLLSPIVWASVLLLSIVLLVWFSGDDCDDDEDEDDADGNDGTEPLSSADDEPEPSQEVANSPPAPVGVGGAVTRTMSVLAVAALLVFGTGVTPAAASGLSINTVGAGAVISKARCAPGTWGATVAGTPSAGNYTQVQLSAIPAGCQGLLATVYVHNSAGAVIATGTVTPAGATATATTSSYSGAAVTTVFVKVQGWPLKTTWTPPAPPGTAWTCIAVNPGGATNTGYPCSVSISPAGGPPWGYDNGTMLWNYSFSVTWTGQQPPNNSWKWRVTFNHAVAPFPGFTPQWVGMYSNPGIQLAPGYSCSQQPIMSIQSTSRNVWGGSFEIANGPAPSWFSGQSLCS